MDPLIICKSRQRAENWTREEKSLLFHLMRESAPVIESKKTDKETNLKKGKEWLKVQKRFVTLTGRSRDVEQIKRFWIRIKRSAAHHKKSVRPKEPAASAIKTKSARELHPNSKHIRLVFKKKEIKIDKNAVGLHQPQSACQVEKKNLKQPIRFSCKRTQNSQ